MPDLTGVTQALEGCRSIVTPSIREISLGNYLIADRGTFGAGRLWPLLFSRGGNRHPGWISCRV